MAKLWTTVVLVGVLAAHAAPGFAQTVEEPPLLPSSSLPVELAWLTPDFSSLVFLTPVDLAEMRHWVEGFTAWQEWSAQWRGLREPGWLTTYRDRRPKPPPPAWLPARCATVFDEEDLLATACTLLTMWSADDLQPQALRSAAVVAGAKEDVPNKNFWEHLHVDLLWPDLQWGSSIYGVVGVHHATTVKGRLQVFTAPGALLLNLPSYNGTRTWKVAVNYGIGYRLFDFSLFGRRPAELHFNMAKTWIMSDTTDVAVGRSIDVVGFSISFKRAAQ